jgi:hypothetical protein
MYGIRIRAVSHIHAVSDTGTPVICRILASQLDTRIWYDTGMPVICRILAS